MKYWLAIFIALSATVVNAQLTDQQVAKCAAEGGCLTMTREALVKALNEAHANGKSVGAAQRCWRPT